MPPPLLPAHETATPGRQGAEGQPLDPVSQVPLTLRIQLVENLSWGQATKSPGEPLGGCGAPHPQLPSQCSPGRVQ